MDVPPRVQIRVLAARLGGRRLLRADRPARRPVGARGARPRPAHPPARRAAADPRARPQRAHRPGAPQARAGVHRPADPAREPATPRRRPSREARRRDRRPARGADALRPRRLQALQRHLRPRGRRRPAGAARREAGRGRRARRHGLPARRRRVLRPHRGAATDQLDARLSAAADALTRERRGVLGHRLLRRDPAAARVRRPGPRHPARRRADVRAASAAATPARASRPATC